MQNEAFQLNKVRRLILTQGQPFTVLRPGANEFGEPNGTTESYSIAGVYHETTSYLTKTTVEATTLVKKSCPMVLALWEDIVDKLRKGDTISFNESSYQVNAIKNLAEANLVADISLEEVQTPNGIRV